MKYLFISMLLLTACVASAQQKNKTQFVINGTINGQDGNWMYLYYPAIDGQRKADSIKISQSRFFFKGNVNGTVNGFMRLKADKLGPDNFMTLFIAPTLMTVKLQKDQFSKAVVTGSSAHTDYVLIQNKLEKIRKRWKGIMDTLSAANKRSNFEFQALKNWVLVPYNEEINEISTDYISSHPSSYLSPYLLLSPGYEVTTDSLKLIYARFHENIKQGYLGKNVYAELEKRKIGVPGSMAYVFSSKDINDKPLSLSDFKGKYVLLDFWASWCLPCRQLNPHLKQLYAKYKANGFEVIGIADDDMAVAAWKKAVADDGLPWNQILTGKLNAKGTIDVSNGLPRQYNIGTLPTQILIDPSGKIIARYGSGGEPHEMLDKALESVFKKPATGMPGSTAIRFTGKADPRFNGSKMVLYNHVTKDHDSAYVKDGRFVFTIPFKGASCYYFYSEYESKKNGGYSPFGILVTKPGNIDMDANLENFSATKVIGSEETELYKRMNAQNAAISKDVQLGLKEKYGEKNPDEKDSRYPAFLEEVKEIRKEYTRRTFDSLQYMAARYPSSYAVIYSLFIYRTNIGVERSEQIYNTLKPVFKDTYEAKQILSFIETSKATQIGKIAPDFTQADTSDAAISLSSLRGKYVLLDFWASWCKPCRAENPNLVKVFNRYKDKGFTVMGVSLDRPGKKEAWIEAIRKDSLTWTNVSDLQFWNNQAAKLYGVESVPQNYLIDPKGIIIGINLKGEELETKLRGLFM